MSRGFCNLQGEAAHVDLCYTIGCANSPFIPWQSKVSLVLISHIFSTNAFITTKYVLPPAWLDVLKLYLCRGGSIFRTADRSVLDPWLDCLPLAAGWSAGCQPAVGASCSFRAWYWRLLSSECPAANGLHHKSTFKYDCTLHCL